MRWAVHTLLLVVAMLFAATPVMACCIEGHATAVDAAAKAAPPCHDPAPAPLDEGACPGCAECGPVASAAEVAAKPGAVAGEPSGVLAAGAGHGLSGPQAARLRNTTGPPGAPDLRAETPVTLKQLLLI